VSPVGKRYRSRAAAFDRLGEKDALEDMVRNRLPDDAAFMADIAKREALKVWLDDAWHMHKRRRT